MKIEVPGSLLNALIFICAIFSPSGALAQTPGEIWISDVGENRVVKLSSDGAQELVSIEGFSSPVDIDMDFQRGWIWVVDKYEGKIFKYSLSGEKMGMRGGFDAPFHGAVNTSSGDYFVAEKLGRKINGFRPDKIRRFSQITGFVEPHDIVYSPYDNSFWVTDIGAKKVIKFNARGEKLAELGGFVFPQHIAVDGRRGDLWLCDTNAGEVIKISPSGEAVSARTGGFAYPFEIAVDTRDGSAWVTDAKKGEIVKIAAAGGRIITAGGFAGPYGISDIDSSDGSFWVSEMTVRIVKLSEEGARIKTIDRYKKARKIVLSN